MSPADWSSLRPELLETISRKLIVHADYIRFRSVCTAWRAATPEIPTHLPSQLPWLMLSDNRYNIQRRIRRRGFVTLANKLFYRRLPEASYPRRCCGSSHGWLAIIDEFLQVFLINPLTRARVNLPGISAFPNIISIDFSKVDDLVTLRMKDSDSGAHYSCSLQLKRESFIRKIILSNSPSFGSDFVALAILDQGRQVAYCKSHQNSWNLIEEAQSFSDDITYMNGLFYGLGEWGHIATFDVNGDTPVVEVIETRIPVPFDPEILEDRFGETQYLVHAKGELLMVCRFFKLKNSSEFVDSYETIELKVYKFNFDELCWQRLKSLGDMALFVGGNFPVALLASDFPGCRGNMIYFADDYDCCSDYKLQPDVGMFNLEDCTVERFGCYPQGFDSRLKWPLAVLISPNPCS